MATRAIRREKRGHWINSVMKNIKMRTLFISMVVFGIMVGVIFPYVASFFVYWRSAAHVAFFFVSCVVAGIIVGMFCFWMVKSALIATMGKMIEDVESEIGIHITAEDITGKDKLEMFRHNYVKLVGIISDLILSIRDTGYNLSSSSDMLTKTSRMLLEVSNAQSASVTETTATIEELSLTANQIAGNVGVVVSMSEQTLNGAEDGGKALAEIESSINEVQSTAKSSADRILKLGERSNQIGSILAIINDISKQTNLLALNAAIEAARAGEAGKGFAVVAEEIRKLAEDVRVSTSEIEEIIKEIQSATNLSVMATEESFKKTDFSAHQAQSTAEMFRNILNMARETSEAAKQISVAIQQQKTASDQVVAAMREVAEASRRTSSSSKEVNDSAEGLSSTVMTLKETVSRFRIDVNDTKHCWEITNCDYEARNKCAAFRNEDARCWLLPGTWCHGIEQKDVDAKRRQCMTCPAYLTISGEAQNQ